MKSFALVVVAMAALLFLGAGLGFVFTKEADSALKLERLLDEDMERLQAKNLLPKELKSLSAVELNGGTDTAKSWLKDMAFPFNVKKDGKYLLEVLVVDWTEGPKDGALVQLNLVENKSGNMVWELGRTYILKDRTSTYHQLRNQVMNWLRH